AVAVNTHAPCVLLEEDINQLNNTDLNTSSSMDSSTQTVQPAQPTTLQILDATNLLFDKNMTTHALESKSRRLAIGWVAQAYDMRSRLNSPQGLIYARLKAEQQ